MDNILSVVVSYLLYTKESVLQIYNNLQELRFDFERLKNFQYKNIIEWEIDNVILEYDTVINELKLHIELLQFVEAVQGFSESEKLKYIENINIFMNAILFDKNVYLSVF